MKILEERWSALEVPGAEEVSICWTQRKSKRPVVLFGFGIDSEGFVRTIPVEVDGILPVKGFSSIGASAACVDAVRFASSDDVRIDLEVYDERTESCYRPLVSGIKSSFGSFAWRGSN